MKSVCWPTEAFHSEEGKKIIPNSRREKQTESIACLLDFPALLGKLALYYPFLMDQCVSFNLNFSFTYLGLVNEEYCTPIAQITGYLLFHLHFFTSLSFILIISTDLLGFVSEL